MEKSFFNKIRDTVGKVPNSVKTSLKLGAFAIGKLSGENQAAFEDVAEAQELQQERIVMEQKSRTEAEMRQKSFEEKARRALATSKDAVILDFSAEIGTLSPEVKKTIIDSEVLAVILKNIAEVTEEDAGDLAHSKKATVILPDQVYDVLQKKAAWISVVHKLQPEREYAKGVGRKKST